MRGLSKKTLDIIKLANPDKLYTPAMLATLGEPEDYELARRRFSALARRYFAEPDGYLKRPGQAQTPAYLGSHWAMLALH